MIHSLSKLAIGAVAGTIVMAAAISGCSSLSGSHVDCNVVKLQSNAGRTDDEIASAINASVSDVQKCKGAETSGNATTGAPQSGNY